MPRRFVLSESQYLALSDHLRTHHGVVSSDQLVTLGIPPSYGHVQERSRRWQRVHPGVWADHTGPLPWRARCAAALAALGPEAALDDESAMRCWARGERDRQRFAEAPIRVVVPWSGSRRTLAGVVVRRSRPLTGRSTLVRDGLRVVRYERAVVTFAARRPAVARAALTESVQTGLTVATRLVGAILTLGPVRGRRRLLAVVADITGGTRSELEAAFLQLVRTAGLPVPTRQHELALDGRRLWVDCCYVDARLVIELDGRAYPLLAEDWEHDLDRQNAIVLDGWRVLRFTARMIREQPDRVVAQLREALELALSG
jgi:very-short-patch-repair endonuclease